MIRAERAQREERSCFAYAHAQRFIAGGVNSPVRAFRSVGGTPIFVERASGARFIDVDGNTYVDYVMSWGPLILGHAAPSIVDAVRDAASRGTSYGAPTEAESELARMIIERLPSIDLLRFVSSGTEATMSAVRLARGFTKRDLIVKFAGCYHGHADPFLISAGSGALTHGVPSSPGIPAAVADLTVVLPYNDTQAVRALFEEQGELIAAVIVEPYAGNMGLVIPRPGFLSVLREVTSDYGTVLIFDEVMTGFRVDRGGVQTRERITPDLTTLGKIVGGGLPVGAFGGRAEIMELLSPLGPLYQAGTLSGNPLAMAAGIATLQMLEMNGVYETLEARSRRLIDGMAAAFAAHGIGVQTAQVGSMLGCFFATEPVTDLETAQRADTQRYAQFFHEMRKRGFYFAPSQFEAFFLSLAHDDAIIDQTLTAVQEVAAAMVNA